MRKAIFSVLYFALLFSFVAIPQKSFAVLGDYLNVSYNLATGPDCTDFPFSVAYYNNIFWIGCPDPAIHKFSAVDGSYIGDASFDFAGSGNTGVQGILFYQGYFWIADDSSNTVYKYNPDGSYTGTSFSTAGSGATNLDGIAGYNNFLWISDYTDDEVYKYNLDGTYASSSFDIGFSGNNQPGGITVLEDNFYILDGTDNLIYEYDNTGGSLNNYSTSVNGHTALSSITSDGVNFWVLDFEPNSIYKYEGLDIVSPTVDTFTPADDSSSFHVLTDTIFITFDENVVAGSGYVTIHKASDDSIVEALDVTDTDYVEIDNPDVILHPTNPLVSDTNYYIKVDATAFDDVSGNSFAGIDDETTWNFRTYDDVNPVIVSFNPDDNSNDVDINPTIILTFDEAVTIDDDNILIKKSSDDSVVETIAVDDANVTGSGTDTIVIDPVNNLIYNTEYYVEIGGDAFYDENSNYFAGITGNLVFNFQIKSNVVSSGSPSKSKAKTYDKPNLFLADNNLPSCLPGHLFDANTGKSCESSNNNTPTTPSPDSPKYTFTKNLWSGMIDPEIKELQKYLNTHSFKLTETGLGSPGQETNKFGNLTIKALQKFQIANGLKPDAVVGPKTREVLNKI